MFDVLLHEFVSGSTLEIEAEQKRSSEFSEYDAFLGNIVVDLGENPVRFLEALCNKGGRLFILMG